MPLTQKQTDHLAELMRRRRGQLQDEIREVLIRTGEHPYRDLADIPDLGDESVADLLIDLDNAMVDRGIEEIRDIDSALARIADGSYGICQDCGLDIDQERLLVFPTAKRCLTCQGQHEKTYAHGGTPTL